MKLSFDLINEKKVYKTIVLIFNRCIFVKQIYGVT